MSGPTLDADCTISALVSARLCHDLISPMGAIGNGLELLQLSEGAGKAELALVSDSVAVALAKLRFYRVAFGPADAQARQSFEEAAQITDAMFQGRLTVEWRAAGRDMPRTTAKLIYLAVLCLEKSLPMGGCVRVTLPEPEAESETRRIELSVEGRRTAAPPELWAHLTDGAPVPELRSDGVQFALLRQALVSCGEGIQARFTDSGAAVAMTAPRLMPA